jgi:hypothetical protein
MTFIHGVSCLSAHLLTQLPETTNQPSKPEIIGGSAKPSMSGLGFFYYLLTIFLPIIRVRSSSVSLDE